MSIKDELDPNINPIKPKLIQKTQIKPGEKVVKDIKNLPMQAYLDKTVMPLVLEGMAEVSKIRPDNPIKFLADYLMQHANEKWNIYLLTAFRKVNKEILRKYILKYHIIFYILNQIIKLVFWAKIIKFI